MKLQLPLITSLIFSALLAGSAGASGVSDDAPAAVEAARPKLPGPDPARTLVARGGWGQA